MTIQEINQQLKEVTAKIEKLNFDNNGNAIDREYANSLFEKEEELMNALFGFTTNTSII
jgi:hypothetical protein